MPDVVVLDEDDWLTRAAAHRADVEALTADHQRRAQRGEAHPVWDFLFTYYSLRPRQLRVWHPGYDVALAGPAAAEYLARTGYVATPAGVTVQHTMAWTPAALSLLICGVMSVSFGLNDS